MWDTFSHIGIWVLGSVAISLALGYFIGRSGRKPAAPPEDPADRAAALKALVELLGSVEQLTTDVDHRSTEMRAVHSHVGDIQASGELEVVRVSLLTQLQAVITSNQRLEEDLEYARCRMEQQAEEIDRTRREARTDALSGVANRKAFDEKLLVMLGNMKRGGQPFVLLLADTDHFKWVNDTHGHAAGDTVLRALGDLLRRCTREGDFVARYGGDEFAVVLPKIDPSVALQVAERMRVECTRTSFGLPDSEEAAAVTLSLGLAQAQAGDTPQSLIERADEALYASKRGGRNRASFQPSAEQRAAFFSGGAFAPGEAAVELTQTGV